VKKQSLKALFGRLDARDAAIPLAELQAELGKTDLVSEDFQQVVAFGDKTYRRNLLHEGPAYLALVICWRPGQRSPIHDHSGSSCAVQVLGGIATETAFAQTGQGHVYATASTDHGVGSVLGSFDADAHQISNLQPAGHDLVTLHIYSPPLLQMKRFSLTDAHWETFMDPIELFIEGAGI
jgi:cysteine dioxygenase